MEHIYRLAAATEVAAMVSHLVVSEQFVQAREYAAEAVDAAAGPALVAPCLWCLLIVCVVDGVVPFSS